MANNASDYTELAVFKHLFSNNGSSVQSGFPPTSDNIWVSLHTSTGPTEDGVIGTSNEVSTSGSTAYARSNAGDALTWTVSQTDVANAVTTAVNDQAIAFVQAGANYSADLTFIGIYDAETVGTGNLLFYGALSVNKTVTTGDTFQINAGALVITLE